MGEGLGMILKGWVRFSHHFQADDPSRSHEAPAMRRLRCRISVLSAPRDAICFVSKSRDRLGTGVKRERLIGGVTSRAAMRLSAPVAPKPMGYPSLMHRRVVAEEEDAAH